MKQAWITVAVFVGGTVLGFLGIAGGFLATLDHRAPGDDSEIVAVTRHPRFAEGQKLSLV